MQRHLPQQKIQKRGLSVQAPSSNDNEKLKVVTAVRQIIRELIKAVSEEDKIMVITKMLRNETKWQLKFIGLSKPWHSEAAL
jgi:hypothetical protein